MNTSFELLNKNNVLVYVFRMTKDPFVESNTTNVRLRHSSDCICHSSQTMKSHLT